MPYDPRMLQRGGMMPSQQGGGFDPYATPQNAWWQQGSQAQQGAQFAPVPQQQQPKQWYEGPQVPKDPYGKDKDGKPQPSLLQMLMLGGKPTYSGTPQPGGAAPAGYSPWSWLGSMGLPGGAGWGGGGGGAG